jgi:hypothetical protein
LTISYSLQTQADVILPDTMICNHPGRTTKAAWRGLPGQYHGGIGSGLSDYVQRVIGACCPGNCTDNIPVIAIAEELVGKIPSSFPKRPMRSKGVNMCAIQEVALGLHGKPGARITGIAALENIKDRLYDVKRHVVAAFVGQEKG